MASHPRSNPIQPAQQPHAAPYCNDPLCEHCKQLREMQDLIRMHESPGEHPAESHVNGNDVSEDNR